MSFQQNRNNLHPYNSQPIFRPIYTQLQNNPTATNQPQYYIQRQQNNINHFSNVGFNSKGYAFQGKEFFRPQQVPANTPLSFNVHTPLRAKGGKKTSRPFQKITKSVINNPFTKQLQDEFAKKQSNKQITNLDDFSKTTSTVTNPSFFKQQTNYTQPQEYPYKKPQQGYFNKSTENIVTLEAFVKRGETQSKIFDNYSNYNSTSAVNYESTREKSLQKNRNNFFQEVNKLNKEIKHLKEENSLKDRTAKETNDLLEFQYQKTNKLLNQIETMEKELRGVHELNKFLQHQCNLYLQNYNKIKLQLETSQFHYTQEHQKQQQIIITLKKQIQQLQHQQQSRKERQFTMQGQISNLKKIIKSQQEKNQERETNNRIDISQMNILKTKLQNLQAKYEKLMLNHCENEIKYHHEEENFNLKKMEYENQIARLMGEVNGLRQGEKKLEYACNEKGIEISQMKEEIERINSQNAQRLANLERKYNCLHHEYLDLEKDLIDQKERSSKLVIQLQGSSSTLTQKESSLAQLAKQLQILTQQNQLLKQANDDLHIENTQLKESQEFLNQTINAIRLQSLSLKEQQQRLYKLLHQTNLVVQQYRKELNSTNLLLEQNRKQVNSILESSNKIESQSTEINKKYQSLLNNYNAQNKHYKQLEAHLIQNEFDYNILQKDFNEYTQKYHHIVQENQNLQRLNHHLQQEYSELFERNQLDRKSKDEMEEKYQESLLQIEEANEKMILMEKQKNDIEKLIEINKKLHQSSYGKLSKDNKAMQEQLNALKQKQAQLIQEKKQECELKQSSISLLKDEISSLMLIIQENQQRYKLEKQELALRISKNQEDEAKNLEEYQNIIATSKEVSQKYKIQLQTALQESKSLKQQLQHKNNTIFELQLTISQFPTFPPSPQPRQCMSSSSLPQQSLQSPLKLRQYDSQTDLLPPTQVNYIQMDAQGIFFLCQLLQINAKDGNILNQIVSKIQSILLDTNQSKRTNDSYKKILEMFEIEDNESSDDLLMHQITTIKENLTMVIQKLKEEESMHQALKKQNYHLLRIKQSQQFKHQICMDQLFNLNILNQELNQNVVKMAAVTCNQKLQMKQAMKIAIQGMILRQNEKKTIDLVKVQSSDSFWQEVQGQGWVGIEGKEQLI